MAAMCRLLVNVVILMLIQQAVCWDSDDFELFDLVEEVNENFYEVLGISQTAPAADVRKAYRKLSLQLHPDKNKAEDAELKFRQLVAIYEVLKDEDKRQRYNLVLEEGLPDWKQPVFYYRRVRKLSLTDLLLLLTPVFTIGQYLVLWAVYFERRLTLEDIFAAKSKKKRKRRGGGGEEEMEELMQEEISSIPKPRLLDLWPVTLSCLMVSTLRNLPSYVSSAKEWLEERRAKPEEEEEEVQEGTDIVRKPKRKRVDVIPEYCPEMYEMSSPTGHFTGMDEESRSHQSYTERIPKGDEWTEEELILFSKAVNKFPGGTHQRWDKIAAAVGRSVEEVTAKAKHIRGSFNPGISVAAQGAIPRNKKMDELKDDIITKSYVDSYLNSRVNQDGEASSQTQSAVSVTHSQAEGDGDYRGQMSPTDATDLWTQTQQQTFEWALRHYPKGTDKRWDKIAEQITGKSKEDCKARFKLLAEMVKKRKEAKPTLTS